MKKLWIMLADRFDARQPRERVAIFVSLVVVVVGIFALMVFDPAYTRYQKARESLQSSDTAAKTAETDLLTAMAEAARDPDADTRAKIKALSDSNTALQKQLAGEKDKLVDAQKMNAILHELMAPQRGLEFVSAKTLEPVDLLGKQSDSGGAASSAPAVPISADMPGLYRHDLELIVLGDYKTLSAYVKKVETLPWNLYVSEVGITTDEWPRARMKVVLYTLSMERTWLSF